MAKILVCLLGFPLSADKPLKLSLHALSKIRNAKVKVAVGFETARERNIKELVQLLEEEMEALSALKRAKQLLPDSQFETFFKLCKHSGISMTKEKFEHCEKRLPTTQAAHDLLSFVNKNLIPCINLDLSQSDIKQMLHTVDAADSIEEKIAIQASYENQRMKAMTTNLMRGIKYLSGSGGILWVADLRRHHVSRLAAHLAHALSEQSLNEAEIEIVSFVSPSETEDESLIQSMTEQAFMHYDSKEIQQYSALHEPKLLEINIDPLTNAYHCEALDSLLDHFVTQHMKENQQVISINAKETPNVSSALMSWLELRQWCLMQKTHANRS